MIAIASVMAALCLAGCDRADIHAYTAPKEPPRPTVTVAAPEDAPVQRSLTWSVPQDWRPADDPPRFVLAAYDAGDGDAAIQTTVSRLAGAGGGALANINRWRGQIGLPPVSDLPEQPITPLDVGDDAAALVDLSGDDTRVVAVIYPRQSHDETWFFKMTGPPQAVETQKQDFIDMVRSARPVEGSE